MSVRPTGTSANIPHLDKGLHALAYGVLATVTAFAFPRMRLIFVFVWMSLFGVAMEIAQAFVGSGRKASIADSIANSVGVLCVIGIWVVWINLRSRSHSPEF